MYQSLFGNASGKKRAADIKKHTVVTKSSNKPSPRTELRDIRHQSIKGVGTKTPKSLKASVTRNRPDRPRTRYSRPTIDFGSEDSDNEENGTCLHKKLRWEENQEPDLSRRVRSTRAFQEDVGVFPMLHAANIPSNDTTTKYEPSVPGLPGDYELELQYPSVSQRERFAQPLHFLSRV